MRILAMETSGVYGGIALAEGPEVVAEVRLAERLRHARALVAMVRDACAGPAGRRGRSTWWR